MGKCKQLHRWFSRCPLCTSSSSTRQLVEMQTLGCPPPPPPDLLTQKLWGWGQLSSPTILTTIQMILKLENNWFKPLHRMEGTNFLVIN